jgi:hypothetical protein
MCKGSDDFNYFPPITVGGPTGDYYITTPVTSSRWTEYAIISVANGDGGIASIFLTGDDKPSQLVYDGSKILSADAFVPGVAIRVASTTTTSFDSDAWFRVTHSQKRVFIRIDAGASSSCYVTLRFRDKLVTVVPGPSVTVHPDHQQQLNIARSEKTKERLSKLGIPAYAQEGV